MHELYCPACNNSSQYDFSDYLLMCPFCSTTFKVDLATGNKSLFGDHFVIPNTIDPATVKDLALEWLKRLHHKPGQVESEFFVTDIQGMSIPLWIVSLEGHTSWKGLVKKHTKMMTRAEGNQYLTEQGQFRRSYRWAISARKNICETWGLARLHQPVEQIPVEWDGFPLDSTLSRGRLVAGENLKPAYEVRKYFEFKFANGLPILGIQINEDEALRRTKSHIELYHHKLSCQNVDYLVDVRTELEIAGIQLIHTPFWKVTYMYRPRNSLRYFFKPQEKRLIIDGYGKGMLKGELAIAYNDKVTINGIVCCLAFLVFFVLGLVWHPALLMAALFSLIVGLISLYVGATKRKQLEEELKHSEPQPA
jgi:hypothetical protein